MKNLARELEFIANALLAVARRLSAESSAPALRVRRRSVAKLRVIKGGLSSDTVESEFKDGGISPPKFEE